MVSVRGATVFVKEVHLFLGGQALATAVGSLGDDAGSAGGDLGWEDLASGHLGQAVVGVHLCVLVVGVGEQLARDLVALVTVFLVEGC